jgi:hypothetical protein
MWTALLRSGTRFLKVEEIIRWMNASVMNRE